MTLAALSDFIDVRFAPDRPQLKDTMKIGMPTDASVAEEFRFPI
jgi:hypothetical protein